jgi:hypothetical protein
MFSISCTTSGGSAYVKETVGFTDSLVAGDGEGLAMGGDGDGARLGDRSESDGG